jgi:hypothetical protein
MIAAAGYFAYKQGIIANIDLKATATTSLFWLKTSKKYWQIRLLRV